LDYDHPWARLSVGGIGMKRGETFSEHRKKLKEMSKQFPTPKKWIAIFILFTFVTITSSWGLAYLLMRWIAHTWFPQYGITMLRQYLTVVLAFFILILIMEIIRIFFKPVREQMTWFMNMINAMKQLAKGDFNVNIEFNSRYMGMGQIGSLVKSFNEMASDLNQMEQMRQEFISNVSHEIQSPLTSITGFARALKNEDLPMETRKHYLDIIEIESKRLSRMSDNLLKLTSLESKHHPFEKRTYRIDRQLRHIILSCEPLWQEKNIEMDVELPEHIVTADEDLLSQVWVNLLHNSIKFTPNGGKISVRLTKQDNSLIVEISDNGIGISEKALHHLFERFYKEDKARNRSGSGSGLGLSIVKKIIEMHDGEVFAESHPGDGSKFSVALPIS
jgi:two-component system phosphate regulon sensor histidine kinase PhoR